MKVVIKIIGVAFLAYLFICMISCARISKIVNEPNPACKLQGYCHGHYGNRYCMPIHSHDEFIYGNSVYSAYYTNSNPSK